MPDLSAFETSNWKRLSTHRRVDALQGLENSMAAKQGRSPRSVVLDGNMPDARHGQYNPGDPDILRVNMNLVKSDNGNYQAMQSTIHEGRHAYQDDCIRSRATALPQDRSRVESWAHNMPGRGGVYNTDGVDYRYQPVEADANDYARGEMNRFSSQYGNDPAYNDFSTARDQNDRKTELYARMQHGEHYEQVIRQDIDKRYQEKAQQVNAQNTGDKAAKDKTGGKKDMFDFRKDRAQRQQSTPASFQQSGEGKGKAFRQSLKVDTCRQPQAAGQKVSQYKALAKASLSGKPSAHPGLRGGQER